MSRILITGTSGFIGCFLAKHFLRSDCKVLGLSRHENIDLKHPNFEWTQSDLITESTELTDVDICIHAAAQSPAPGATTYDFVNHNLVATQNLLQALEKSGCRKIIFLSAVSVYGDVNVPEVNEQTSVINPDSYGLSKLLAERMLQEQKSIPVCVLRLPGVLGKEANAPWLVRQIRKAIRNETINIYNPDDFFNNAVCLEDLADFIQQLSKENYKKHQLFILGAEKKQSIRTIVELIRNRTHSQSRIMDAPEKYSFTLNFSKAKNTGYKPQTLESMLINQIDCELNEPGDHAID